MLEINKIYNMDCLDGMRLMREQGIKADWVLTDPPYGINIDKKFYISGGTKYGAAAAPKTIYTQKNWDECRPRKEYFDLMREISKDQVIFGGNYFADMLPPTSCYIVWDKQNDGKSFANCELAWCSQQTAVRIIRYLWDGMLQGNMRNKEERIHPTQKPLPVIEWILSKYTQEGDLILDPFMGSGTTAIACHKLQRNYIGFELDKEYFELASKRIERETAQLSLFDII